MDNFQRNPNASLPTVKKKKNHRSMSLVFHYLQITGMQPKRRFDIVGTSTAQIHTRALQSYRQLSK
jgi:hypothetical protein